jgi:hypothetical protein
MNSMARATRNLIAEASTSGAVLENGLKVIPTIFFRSYHKNVSS